MLENLSSTQKAVGGVVVIASVVGWIFAFVQIGEIAKRRPQLPQRILFPGRCLDE